MKRRVAVALVLLAGLGTACGDAPQGAALFDQSCASCHDLTGSASGLGPGSPIDGMTDAEVAAIIENGRGGMPAFPKLSATQVSGLVDYLRDLATP